MILLFGTKAYESLLVSLVSVCRHCGVSANQRVFERVVRFTLFFVPLFRVSSKHFVECSNCGAETPLTREQAEHSLRWASSHGGVVPKS